MVVQTSRPPSPPGQRFTEASAVLAEGRAGSRRRRWLGAAVVLVIVLGAVAGLRFLPAQPAPSAPTSELAPTTPKLTARGEVRPAAQAKIGALSGGTVTRLTVQVGDVVEEQQEIARVRGSDGTVEVLTAPWRGTITSVPAHFGDSVTPGTTIATVGDLSRLQVETTDVDEFIIGQVFKGQTVTAQIDALDQRPYTGHVRTVALLPEQTEAGDDHYPVVIDLVGSTRDLRLGMTVRINFSPEAP